MSLVEKLEKKLPLGPLAIVLASLLWSIAGLFIKFIDWPPLAIASARSLFASSVFFIYFGKRLFVRPNLTTWISGLALALTQTLFVTANKLTTATNAIMLQYTAPVFVVLINAAIYKIRPQRRELLALFGTMAGVLLFFLDKIEGGGLAGNLIAVFTGLTFAIVFVLNSRPNCQVPTALFIGQAGTFLIGLPQLLLLDPALLTQKALLSVTILGIFQLGVAYVIFQAGIRRTTPLNASLLSVVEPLMNPVWVFVALGEKPGSLALAGAAIIISAVLSLNIRGRKNLQEPT